MAILTTVQPAYAGTAAAPATPQAGGDKFLNDGSTIFLIENGSASSRTVTVAVPGTAEGLAITAPVVTIPAGERRICGPYPPRFFNDVDGYVNLSYSAVANMSITVYKAK
jgi:hypothetical protein